jgi:hypothetical protein
MRRWLLPAALAATLTVACGSSATSPSDPLTGVWSGTLDDSQMGVTNATLTLQGNVTNGSPGATGQWMSGFSSPYDHGSVVMTTVSSQLVLVMTTSATVPCLGGAAPSSVSLLSNVTLTGSSLTGRYFGLDCVLHTVSGTLTLTRP